MTTVEPNRDPRECPAIACPNDSCLGPRCECPPCACPPCKARRLLELNLGARARPMTPPRPDPLVLFDPTPGAPHA